MDRSRAMVGYLRDFQEFYIDENQDFILYLMAVGAEINPTEEGGRRVFFDSENGIHGGKVMYKYANRFKKLDNISGYCIMIDDALIDITQENFETYKDLMCKENIYHGEKLNQYLINNGGQNGEHI